MNETMIDTQVTYALEQDGKFFLVEHVPARVCRETGEQFFSPDTVEHLHDVIESGKKPARLIETPVFDFA